MGKKVRTLRVASWAGEYAAAQKDLFNKFTEQTGIAVEMVDYSGSYPLFIKEKDSLDLVDFAAVDYFRAVHAGELAPIDKDQEFGSGVWDFMPRALQKHGVASVVWSMVLAYNKGQWQTTPENIAAFFSTKDFPGKRGLVNVLPGNIEFSLLAQGLSVNKIYKSLLEGGFEGALEQYKGIQEYTSLFDNYYDIRVALERGHVAAAWLPVNDAVVAAKSAEIDFHQGQALMGYNYWGVPKGSASYDSALQLIKFMTDPQMNAQLVTALHVGWVRWSTPAYVELEVLRDIPNLVSARWGKSVWYKPSFWLQGGVADVSLESALQTGVELAIDKQQKGADNFIIEGPDAADSSDDESLNRDNSSQAASVIAKGKADDLSKDAKDGAAKDSDAKDGAGGQQQKTSSGRRRSRRRPAVDSDKVAGNVADNKENSSGGEHAGRLEGDKGATDNGIRGDRDAKKATGEEAAIDLDADAWLGGGSSSVVSAKKSTSGGSRRRVGRKTQKKDDDSSD